MRSWRIYRTLFDVACCEHAANLAAAVNAAAAFSDFFRAKPPVLVFPLDFVTGGGVWTIAHKLFEVEFQHQAVVLNPFQFSCDVVFDAEERPLVVQEFLKKHTP